MARQSRPSTYIIGLAPFDDGFSQVLWGLEHVIRTALSSVSSFLGSISLFYFNCSLRHRLLVEWYSCRTNIIMQQNELVLLGDFAHNDLIAFSSSDITQRFTITKKTTLRSKGRKNSSHLAFISCQILWARNDCLSFTNSAVTN